MIPYNSTSGSIMRPSQKIAGVRNRIIHEYAEIDPDIVWGFVHNEAPRLLENSESLLKGEPDHGD